MKRTTMRRLGLALGTTITAASLTFLPVSALSAASSANANTAAARDQTKIQLIIKRGDSEISRRLTTLQNLSKIIGSATKLTDSDKATLSSEVTDEINNLNSLKATLDADTTLAAAKADAQSIITGYRVYALIVPKVNLVKVADDQQVAEAKLFVLIAKFETRINAAKSQGKNVTALRTALTSLEGHANAAQAISAQIGSSVIDLQPSDYNSNHSVLSGNRDQLKTAQTNIKAAVSDATTIVNGLKNI